MWNNRETLLLPRFEQGRLHRLLLLTVEMGLSAFLILTGKLMIVIILIALVWVTWFTYRWPIFLAGIAVLQSVHFFRLVPPDALIKWQLAPGLRINALDAVVLLSLPLAIVRFIERKEKPLFVAPVVLILGVAFLNLGLGLVFRTTNLDYGMGFLRTIFYYAAYFILVSAIDSPQRLRQWIGFLYAVFLISIALQLVEAITGLRLTLGLGEYYTYTSEGRLLIGGYRVMYLWNRAPLFAFLVLFLGLGVLFQGRKKKWTLFISILGIGSMFLAFVRQWYVYLIIGILALLVIQTERRFRNLIVVILIITFLMGLLLVISPVLQSSFGPSFLNAWFVRFNSLIHYQTEENFSFRMLIIKAQWKMFLKSPLVGYGLSPVFREKMSHDTGITNTLVQFGLLGFCSVLLLIISFLRHAFRLLLQEVSSVQIGYVSGLIALWICIIIGSLFSVNYFTGMEGIWMVIVILALLDRFHAYVPKRAVKEKIETS